MDTSVPVSKLSKMRQARTSAERGLEAGMCVDGAYLSRGGCTWERVSLACFVASRL